MHCTQRVHTAYHKHTSPPGPARADEESIEEEVKKKSATPDAAGAKTLCLPFEAPPLADGAVCFYSGKPAKNWALWGRSY